MQLLLSVDLSVQSERRAAQSSNLANQLPSFHTSLRESIGGHDIFIEYTHVFTALEARTRSGNVRTSSGIVCCVPPRHSLHCMTHPDSKGRQPTAPCMASGLPHNSLALDCSQLSDTSCSQINRRSSTSRSMLYCIAGRLGGGLAESL